MAKFVCTTTCYWGPTVGTETIWNPGDVYQSANPKEKTPEHFEKEKVEPIETLPIQEQG